MEVNTSPTNKQSKQLLYSIFYGIVFFFLYFVLGYVSKRTIAGIVSGLVNGSLIFILNYIIPVDKFWTPLETKREKTDNYIWWTSVLIFTYIIYGIISLFF
ncbi:MAG: hypothetical protein ACW99A_00315 [Candidatus Kariarchaeaceae archaeon]